MLPHVLWDLDNLAIYYGVDQRKAHGFELGAWPRALLPQLVVSKHCNGTLPSGATRTTRCYTIIRF